MATRADIDHRSATGRFLVAESGADEAADARLRHPAVNPIAARRRIADASIDADRYPL
jgi:hypothetical protein